METELERILKLIADIKDSGNNTAARVREVLTAMAMFSDNSGGGGFEIASEALITSETQNYHYSFKGIKGQCCNAYLLLNNNGEDIPPATTHVPANQAMGSNFFPIEVSKENYEILADFIPELRQDAMYLTFIVPTLTKETYRNMMIVLTTVTDEKDGTLRYYVYVATDLIKGETISTSIALNFKAYRADKSPDKVVKRFNESVKSDTTRFEMAKKAIVKGTENIKP